MQLNLNKPFVALNKAYRKQNLNQEQILSFKNNLKTLFQDCEHAENKKESEEHFKNIVSEFLKDTYFKGNYFMNTEKRKDLVIHNDKNASSSIGVIIEVKRPSQKAEMISAEKPNAKALHEILHYYLQERYLNNNKHIKHLVITNIYDWYIFDGADFERFFFENPKLKKQYKDWNDGLFGVHKTDWFYQEVAKPFIDKELTELNCTHFNLKEITPSLLGRAGEGFEAEGVEKDDRIFIDYYKIFSAEHLLKKPFANDSNTLNKEFYNELLHIIGLEESKDSGKKIIKRKPENNRNEGSLLENTINILQIRNKINAFEQVSQFGDNHEEQIFSLGLELCITWLNRVLFLKLLEGQLLKYHGGDENYRFLNSERIKDFDELNELFFEVLAVPAEKRMASVVQKFGNLPYLNSSLFEESEVESKALVIADLKDRLTMPLMGNTVLKTTNGTKAGGEANTLAYLFEFLNAYNFESDSRAEIQTQNKTIINASVLGLIFEKINGYKDGSFFTPSFITMYMCRETIRKAVIQKFSYLSQDGEIFNTIDDIYRLIPSKISRKEANGLINGIKICDPAVGSGHFLVSALNEIISIKNDLKILEDKNGKSLNRYEITIENDELIITNEDGEPFAYNYKSPESQRIQETLFLEKQTIIENCLFGVDINPKSVMICRLRLWIELLKNAYYRNDECLMLNDELETKIIKHSSLSIKHSLQTLPNIDINIKCGNSLVSRFGVDTDLAKALRSIKYSINDYKGFVQDYKNANNKDLKRGLELILKEIKSNFRTEIAKYSNPKILQLKKLTEELNDRFEANLLFGSQLTEKQQNERDKLVEKVNAIKADVDDLQNAKIYQNAFEWRFEFPEVLDQNGNFIGFDAVIGNPPYGVKLDNREFYKKLYPETSIGQIDTYKYFIDLSFTVIKENGYISFITPDSYLEKKYFSDLRILISKKSKSVRHLKLGDNIFEEAVVPTLTFMYQQGSNCEYFEFRDITNLENNESKKIELENIEFNQVIVNPLNSFIEKTSIINTEGCISLSEIYDQVMGVKVYQVGKGKPKQTEFEVANNTFITSIKIDENHFPFISQGIKRYFYEEKNEFINYGEHLAEPRNLKYFVGEKVVVREIVNPQIYAMFFSTPCVVKNIAAVIIPKSEKFTLKYLLALLNSKLFTFYVFEQNPKSSNKTYPSFSSELIKNLPIKEISLSEQQPFIDLVDLILAGKQTNTKTEDLEAQIDEMVFALYGITAEERAMIM